MNLPIYPEFINNSRTMEKQEIRALSLQFSSIPKDKEQNFKQVRSLLAPFQGKEVDLIVLPEFFSTGLCRETPLELAENLNRGVTFDFLKQLARDFNTNLVGGSVITKTGNHFYNVVPVFNREGDMLAAYRKIHLYDFLGGDEGKNVTAGNQIVYADLDFGRVGIACCFDLMFPVHFHRLTILNCDLIALPAAWMVPNRNETRQNNNEMFQALARVRAYENAVGFITANQITDLKPYCAIGYSQIIHPYGKTLANAQEQHIVLEATFDIEKMRKYRRNRFPLVSLVT